ncbi:MAG: branched-chain amino acid ABC transporter permease [Bradyrhizobiaceae bacterium]|nr:MAG: branched-chain amino acid ABC transporter permease [Bradyrhizobiaceae bacterium]
MLYLQILVNGILLGGLYACIAAGFSLVWGVLNIINVLHGSFIVLGAYLAFFAYTMAGVHPYVFAPFAALLLFVLGYVLQLSIINRVIEAPVLVTMTATFGLTLLLDNLMLIAFKADFRKVSLNPSLGIIDLSDTFPALDIIVPVDRLASMMFALLFVLLLYWLLRHTAIGRAIVAVRMDRYAAVLMGVDAGKVFALTFALGAALAGAAGALLSPIFPISPLAGTAYLGKAFVICVLGGLGSVTGVLVGGLILGIIESFGALFFGPENSLTLSFTVLILLLIFRPNGIMGKRGFV